jgi:hypothetical protein
MLTGLLLRRPVSRGRQRAGKAEAVKVDAPARRASRYVQDGKRQTAQNNRSGTTQTATVTTWLPLITAATCAAHVGCAATVRDGSQSAASAGWSRHGEHAGVRVSVAETLIDEVCQRPRCAKSHIRR